MNLRSSSNLTRVAIWSTCQLCRKSAPLATHLSMPCRWLARRSRCHSNIAATTVFPFRPNHHRNSTRSGSPFRLWHEGTVARPQCTLRRLRTVIAIEAGQQYDEAGQCLPSTGSVAHDGCLASSPARLTALLRMLSPARLSRWALCTRRSRMASATVGLAIISCQCLTSI